MFYLLLMVMKKMLLSCDDYPDQALGLCLDDHLGRGLDSDKQFMLLLGDLCQFTSLNLLKLDSPSQRQ